MPCSEDTARCCQRLVLACVEGLPGKVAKLLLFLLCFVLLYPRLTLPLSSAPLQDDLLRILSKGENMHKSSGSVIYLHKNTTVPQFHP